MGKASVFSLSLSSCHLETQELWVSYWLEIAHLYLSMTPKGGGREHLCLVRWQESGLRVILGTGLCVKGHLPVWTMWGSMNLTQGEADLGPFKGPEKFLILWGKCSPRSGPWGDHWTVSFSLISKLHSLILFHCWESPFVPFVNGEYILQALVVSKEGSRTAWKHLRYQWRRVRSVPSHSLLQSCLPLGWVGS